MSYFYPDALNAMEKIAVDFFQRARPGQLAQVRVVADASTGTASVDWRLSTSPHAWSYITINLPVKPATYRMTAEEFEDWCAYNLHEIGHPLWTDKEVWKAATESNRHRLLNSLEDVREEKCTIDLGLALNATAAFSRLIDKLHAKGSTHYDPNEVQSIGWTLSYLGRVANGYALDADSVMKRLDPKGIVGGIVPWALKELADCKSTQDCLDLSDKIVAAVRAAKKAEKEAEKAEQPEVEQPEVEQPEVEDQPDAEVEMPDMPEIEDMPEVPVNDGGRSEDRGGDIPDEVSNESGVVHGEKDQPEPKPEKEPEPEKEFSDEDIDEVSLKPNDKEELMSNMGNRALVQGEVIRALRRVASLPATDRDVMGRNTNGSVELVTGDASKMGQQRALLARALKRNEEDRHDRGRLSGRLDSRALHKVAARDGRIFGKRITNEGYDTDVQILVDGSGSMSGPKILAASSLALVVAQAAAQVGVSCTTHVFNDNGLHAATRGRAKPVARKFAYMANQIMGGTPLTENMLKVTKMQKARAMSKRKVLFVITDGGCDMGPAVVKACGEYIERVEGVEIANLHIGYQPMGLFRNEAAVNVRKVSETGLRQLTALLEKGA